ncbi:putative benzoyl-CoA reductase, bzd-type, N subunit [delta proteobacterium NaphS2]|nr:putative benzoyl-CoA reductase, bzd-type, N subunit [delta proteobacterium NaphS2]
MINDFIDVYKNRHDYAKDWKKKNPDSKVVGYMCSYFPEELFYAAGMLPVRILGSHEPQNVTEPYIFGMYCPFSRDVLAQGLQGHYDYLDAVSTAYPCMHLGQAFDSWTLHVTQKKFYVDMPNRVQTPYAVPFLTGRLEETKQEIEEWIGREITDSDLKEAINVYNENRALLREIYEMRKADDVPLTGTECMYITTASLFMDKKDANKLLKETIENELKGRKAKTADDTRLMVLGSENDDIKFLNMVEEFSAVIVTDDHCTGSRYFWNPVEEQDDPIQAIAQRYIDRPLCPQRDYPERKRLPYLLDMARDWNVAGIIALQQKFCDPHELDKVALLDWFKENDIPTIYLELDVTVPIGQFKIRVEALLERLREDELW